MDQKRCLYLIPTPISESDVSHFIPPYNLNIINSIRCFVVEDLRTARRFLRKINPTFPIDDCKFELLNEHNNSTPDFGFINNLKEGQHVGLMSEAGCPVIADPGFNLVKWAHKNKIKVTPLSGPSSIIMALMASGFSGQNFTFHGYLPKEKSLLKEKIKEMEMSTLKTGYTQIFMETPYKNDNLIQTLVENLKQDMNLSIACNIGSDDEQIISQAVTEWKSMNVSFHKRPCIFVLGC